MSARQRNRLNKLKELEAANESNESSEDEEEFVVVEKKGQALGFQLMGAMESSSESESESQSDEEEEEEGEGEEPLEQDPASGEDSQDDESGSDVESKTKPPLKGPKQDDNISSKSKEKPEEEEDIDSILKEMNISSQNQAQLDEPNQMGPVGKASLLFADPRYLNQENEIKQKFGSAVIDDGEEEEKSSQVIRRRRGGGRRVVLTPAGAAAAGGGGGGRRRKKCLLGQAKAHWPPPLGRAAGGMGMEALPGPPPHRRSAEGAEEEEEEWDRGAAWFAFAPSPAYAALEARFRGEVLASADPQRLALFCAEHPQHAGALLQLAVALAHSGQMDRAADYVQRCLFYHEAAYAEAFRVQERACRLDACAEANRTYLAALFRHMQMSGMMGSTRTAMEVGKMLLSLDPTGDPMGVLLCLDYYAVVCGEFDFVISIVEEGLPIGYGPEDLATGGGGGGGGGGATCAAAAAAELRPRAGDLPGWAFSAALAAFRRAGPGAGAGAGARAGAEGRAPAAAAAALRRALRRFPGVLPLLVDKIADGSRNWGPVLAALRRRGGGGARGPLAERLAAIYAERGADLWAWGPALDFLHATAVEVAGLAGTASSPSEAEREQEALECEEEARIAKLYAEGSNSSVWKYSQAAPSDFKDEFERLPGDANILDPALLAPRVARRHRQHLDAQMEAQAQWEAAMMASMQAQQANLSPELPLMQLFLASLMPWNSVDLSGQLQAGAAPPPNAGNGGEDEEHDSDDDIYD